MLSGMASEHSRGRPHSATRRRSGRSEDADLCACVPQAEDGLGQAFAEKKDLPNAEDGCHHIPSQVRFLPRAKAA